MILRWPDGSEQLYGLSQSARSHAEGPLDDPRLADDAALEGKSPSLTLAQRPHDLEALDRGVGCLHRLEAAHGADQLLELAVVSLDDVVEVLHLPMPRLFRAFALGLELCDGGGIGRRLVGVEHLGQFLILPPFQGLAEESLRRLGIAGR